MATGTRWIVCKTINYKSCSCLGDVFNNLSIMIRDGKRATVWIQAGNNTFKPVMIRTGLESIDKIEIRSDLATGDIVVISGAYLLNSEYIFKKGMNPMSGHDMKAM